MRSVVKFSVVGFCGIRFALLIVGSVVKAALSTHRTGNRAKAAAITAMR